MALHVGRRPIWLTRSGTCMRGLQRRRSRSDSGFTPEDFEGGPITVSTALGDTTSTTTASTTINSRKNKGNVGGDDDGDGKKKKKGKMQRTIPSNHSFDLLSDAIPTSTTADFDSPNPNGTPFYQTDAPLDPEGERYVVCLVMFSVI